MSKNKSANVFQSISLFLLVILLASGCQVLPVPRAGEMVSENHSFELGEATSVRAEIGMAAGELTVSGGSGKLLEGNFDYNVEGWKPEVSYEVDGDVGTLIITQPDVDENILNSGGQNRWNLVLGEGVPLDLEIGTGAGVTNLDLSTLDLTRVNIQLGAGEGTFNLAGNWEHDVTATIGGGVGNFHVILPGDIGVQVVVESGIGNITASGMMQDGNTYVNDAYGSAVHTLFLEIQSGIGEIELEVR